MNNSLVSLNKKYRHICLDLETTGLDKDKDYIIQIGIIELGYDGEIIDHFCSYTKPTDNITNLSETVSHLTNIKKEDLINAPSLRDILPLIEKYFGEDIIIIGHNIVFDIGFLQKHLPSLFRSHSIDTFDIIGSSIPYLKSYALENIHTHLIKQETYKKIYSHQLKIISGEREQSHDALYDSLLCSCIIQWRIAHIETIFDKYPYLIHLYSKVDKDNGYIEISTGGEGTKDMHMPHIERPLAKNEKREIKDEKNDIFVGQGKKISMKGLSIQELIDRLPQPSIIAVSHPSKIDIIKNACPGYSFDYLKENQVIDFDLYQKRTQKEKLSMSEWLFCLLYIAHASLGYSIIQTTLTEHKHILSYITIKEKEKKYNKHILCTHGGFYAYRDQQSNRSEQLASYTICMRDIDRRYITYNDYSSRYFNPQSLLFHRDELLYHQANDIILQKIDNIDQEIYQSIYDNLLMFLGIFYIESDIIYKKKKSRKWESICKESNDYKRSMILREDIYKSRKKTTTERDTGYLDNMMDKMHKLLSQESIIQYSESTGKGAYYTLTPVHRYIDFSEYNDLFDKHPYCFLSTQRPEYISLIGEKGPKNITNKSISIQSLQSIEDIEEEVMNAGSANIFIISHNSEKSKQIFAHIRQKDYMKDKEILAEYITGGIQKNVAKGGSNKNNKPLFMMGGYHYLLNIWGSNIKTEKIIIYYIPKQRESFIYDDLLRYAPAQ